MKALGILAAYLLSPQTCLYRSVALAVVQSDQSPLQLDREPSNDTARIRNATLADLDDITDTVVEAFSPAPLYRYCYQFREQHVEYHWQCARAGFQRFMEKPVENNAVLKVIDSPTNENPNMSKVVAVALWEYPAVVKSGIPGIFHGGSLISTAFTSHSLMSYLSSTRWWLVC